MMAAKEAGGKGPPTHENDPQCGWFMKKRTNHRDSDFVPCRIFLEAPVDPVTGELTGPEIMRCEVDGRRMDVAGMWTWLAGRPISEDQYMDMIAGTFREVTVPEVKPITPLKITAPASEQILTEPVSDSDTANYTDPYRPSDTKTVF